MPEKNVPSEPPPSYDQATGSSSSARPTASTASSRLEVPSQNGIPRDHRRSMEDEGRPLPKGWVRSFDVKTHHQFFVDTTKTPPRPIWNHPYDDDEYLSTLTSEERERMQEESMHRGQGPSKADIMAAHTDEEDDPTSPTSPSAIPDELPPRTDGKGKGKDSRGFGRKFKDKLTGTTHEQRAEERRLRQEQEQKMYAEHQRLRQAMVTAERTGQPQNVGKDKDGKDVFVEPPGYGGGYGGGGYGYSPYGQSGVYTTPNARYIRPQNPYSRPYGYGYGGGYGLPIGLGIGGGLLGGLLLGDALGGGFGGMGGGMGGGGF